AKGLLVDRVPFSLVETLIWIGVLCTLVLLIIFVSGNRPALKRRPLAHFILVTGPILLIFLGMGQGAFPLSLAPTAWRQPLAEAYQGPDLPYPEFKRLLDLRENRLLRTWAGDYYHSLSEEEVLHGCDQALDSVLQSLGLQKGRTVSRMKPMGPLTTVLGLSYGGPAFHDPFFGEMAMIRAEDHPAPRYWRLVGTCHEAAHAKGFTREMDAEILTQLALDRSEDPRYRMLGDIMFMRKSGERLHYPGALRREILAMRDSLEQVEKRKPVVMFLRKAAIKLGFQNSGAKYGSRQGAENWNPAHPFYATVTGLASNPSGKPPGHGE
ncbi:MAG: DUF3810 family protein, partial [Fibrobacterota bacterium]|nr:DUF3810 family protein [Fibrobacterota bacterium]